MPLGVCVRLSVCMPVCIPCLYSLTPLLHPSNASKTPPESPVHLPLDSARPVAAELSRVAHGMALELRAERAAYEAACAAGTSGASGGGVCRDRVELVTHKHTLDVVLVPGKAPSSKGKGKRVKGGDGNGGDEEPTRQTELMVSRSASGSARRQLLKLNPRHLEKLRAAYAHTMATGTGAGTGTGTGSGTGSGSGPGSGPGPAGENEEDEREQRFLHSLFCLLARYQTIQGHGFQAAVAERAFAVLHRDLGVSMELFASPLNRWLAVTLALALVSTGPHSPYFSLWSTCPLTIIPAMSL